MLELWFGIYPISVKVVRQSVNGFRNTLERPAAITTENPQGFIKRMVLQRLGFIWQRSGKMKAPHLAPFGILVLFLM